MLPPNSTQHDNPYLKAALRLAEDRGKPVFPCRPSDKAPYTPNGFYDATTDPKQITKWWERWPDALIAMPTGPATGVFVVDDDRKKELGVFPHELPETLTVRTRSGGFHYYFHHVDGVRNSAGSLPEGIDVRGEGGYVIVPPSTGYEIVKRFPISPAPERLVELVREKPQRPGPNGGDANRNNVTIALDDTSPIHEGRRNITLTSIAGYRHDGTRDLAQLTGDLLHINAARCTPPLEPDEVEGIAKSIHGLEPCKKGRRFDLPKPEVIGLLRNILKDWWRADWRGTGGKSDRDVLLSYIMFAMEGGTILPNGGILVDVSHHQVAARARKSSSTAYNAHKRLSVGGWCRGGGNGPDRREDRPAGIVLLPRSKQRKPEHPLPSGAVMDGVFDFASLPSARRGRHSAPGLVRLASAGMIAAIDHMERLANWASGRTIADAIGIARVYDLRKRYLEPLEERGVVERCGERRNLRWRLAEDWQDTLERVFAEEEELERKLYSGLTSDERQKKRREEARERYRNRDSTYAGKTPSETDLGRRREEQIRHHDGEVERVQVAARFNKAEVTAAENVGKRKRERSEQDELQAEYDRKAERCQARLKEVS